MTDLEFFTQAAKEDFLNYCIFTDKYFEVENHHKIMAKELQDFMLGKTKRLIIQTPPRSGKSRLVTDAVSWALGTLDNTDIIYTGHTIGLLEGFSRNIRNKVGGAAHQTIFGVGIEEGNSALKSWSTQNGNRFMIYGVGGGITGVGGHRLIIDDPYATRQDAESETIRKTVSNWYNSTFYSRRHNEDAGICIIMQRWREDDLVGEVLAQSGEDWRVIKIPAINERGESFWHKRFSVDELNRVRRQMGDYFFMSQYQQDPINEGSGSFVADYFQKYTKNDILGKDLKIVTFIDPAISTKNSADYTAIVTIELDTKSNNIYILDIYHNRVEPDELIDALFGIVRTYHPETVGIETVAYQKMLALEIRKQMNIRNLYFTLEDVRPMGEKEARIKATLQPRYSNHTVFHTDSQEVKDLELELLKFPNGKHDDIADALSGAVGLLDSVNYSWGENSKILLPDYSSII